MKLERSPHKKITLFVSDIHLSESRDDIVAAFLRFLDEIVIEADSLYILGDLFDFWAGDDIETPLTVTVAQHLRTLQERGVELYFQHGNRDFALGNHYAKRAGITLIPPEYRLPGAPEIILLHGDELCTDDLQYQKYKRWIRHPIILTLLRRLPKRYRLKLAENIRQKSQQREDRAIIDVNEDYVRNYFLEHKVSTLIHGHTHRPNTHQYDEQGQLYRRYVLSDWDRVGDYLRLEAGEITRHHLPIV